MKTIKIFLASSEELKDERNTMADLILHLNKLFRGRGLELDLEKWEYLDASMTGKRKQDEYNEVLKQCDICMVLFWRKFGSFTGEELDTAYNRMKQNEKPNKIYVFFKNPNSNELTQELKDFIANYEQRFGGHFFCKFQNVDTMKLEFLLQLENYQKDMLGEKTIEVRKEHVFVDNEALVDLNNVPFAANNEGFKKRQAELNVLREEITNIQANLEKKQRKLERKKADYEENPDDEDCLEDYQDAKEDVDKLTDDLQKKLDYKNALEDEFEREQQNLFNTARRITEQRGQKISERMARAIEAFESGDAQKADIILDEAEKDFEEARKDFRITKKVSVQALEEQIQRASYKMSNDSIPIEERVAKTLQIYEETDAFAQEINYDQEKYIEFIWDYSDFLQDYAYYDKAIEIRIGLIKICENFYGKEHPGIAGLYNNIGNVCNDLGKYNKAMEYHKLALEIREKNLDKEHPDMAASYNNIGLVYHNLGDYDKALKYHKLALKIRKKVLGNEHPETATSYTCMGLVYHNLCDYDKTLKFFKQALVIQEKVLGKEHPDTAISYNNIGSIYGILDNYGKALKYLKQALDIKEKVLGKEHPGTARSYNNIGNVHKNFGNYDKALDYHKQALAIKEKVLGKEHPDTAGSLINIGNVYSDLGNYDKALSYHIQAAEQGFERAYNELAWTLHLMGKYEEAIPWAEKAVAAFPEDTNNIDTLACVYQDLGRNQEALEKFELCLKLLKEQEGPEERIKETEVKIAALKELMKNGKVSKQ